MKRFYLIGICVVFVFIIPIIFWLIEPEKELKMAIIDKTVPNESYREHLGITWMLNHLKYTNERKEPYKVGRDYFGFLPNEEQKNYEIRSLPTSYDEFDVIYLADTYGVYTEDLPWVDKSREGARSEKIYGGLEEQEWKAIVDRLNKKDKSLLIAEFNTFASPTNAVVRKNVADYLGLDWSGWTGRYFEELDPKLNGEIPKWILDQFGEAWKYSGEGFILVNDIEFEVVVLEGEKHLHDSRISVSFTDEGRKQFGQESSANYKYWFDIVKPKDGSTVLANYEWDLTKEGEELLESNGIPSEFAAVLSNEHGSSSSYYFAGDFNDVVDVPSFYQIKGLQSVYKTAQKFSDQALYWSIYFPMIKSILESFETSLDMKEDVSSKELKYNARIKDNQFEIFQDDKWTPITIKGVNIGMGKPGHFPGEAAITEDDYYRWFEMIGEMNANTIRVYTLHPPGFYQALKRYNDHHEKKIYVLHGVWINEEALVESLDAFEQENLQQFQEEMKRLVDVIHGNKVVEAVPGHASGVYRADISEYVIGWILGIEWYPEMVLNTNKVHASIGEYDGRFFKTENASAFEHWLAQQMDIISQYEMEHYNWIRPISFTNWPTTDLLDHPAEPYDTEDLVSVNPNVIYTKNEMNLIKQFASYHIYPYYPDFFNYEESYQTYVDHRGEFNSYAAYLAELHDAHRLPILVAEFGVPSSRGLTHVNSFGWNQGFLSEREQGEIVNRLFEDIMAEELLGGLVFTWQDEWFKRTWNTMDYDNPDRRPYWSNAQTNEQQFGVLSFDRNRVKVDGSKADWDKESLYEKQNGILNSLYVDHDERYLYIRLDYNSTNKGYPMFLLNIVPEQGNHFINANEQLKFTDGIDFIINLDKKESRVMVDDYYDFFTYQYGHQLDLLKPKPNKPVKNSGEFSPIQYALNKELYLPQQKITLPFSAYETGKLREGNGDPSSAEYDSLADYYINKDGVIELRIPWLLIQAKDPSQKEFIGDIYANGIEASVFINQIHIGALYLNEDEKVIDSFPSITNDVLTEMKGYTWDNWDLPEYEERLKQSYYSLQKLFLQY